MMVHKIARLIDGRTIEKLIDESGKVEYVMMDAGKSIARYDNGIEIELVNASDVDYVDNLYLMSIDCHYLFAAFADNLQDAVEEVGKYCKAQGYDGLLVDAYDEDDEFFDEHYAPINGGQFYLQMPTHAEELKIVGGNVK